MVRAGSRRFWPAVVLLFWQAACAFDSGAAASGSNADGGAIAQPDDSPDSPDGSQGVVPPPSCPDSGDLLACLLFDGAVEDGSAHGVSVQVNGEVAFAPGISGQALDAGEAFEVTIAETAVLDASSALLVELWVNADSLPGADGRAGLVDNNGQWGFFLRGGGGVSCTMAGAVAAEGLIAPGSWQHLACAYDGATTRLYLGGQKVAEAAAGTSLSGGGTDGTAIGRNSPSGDHFDGRIDEVRIWRRGAP